MIKLTSKQVKLMTLKEIDARIRANNKIIDTTAGQPEKLNKTKQAEYYRAISENTLVLTRDPRVTTRSDKRAKAQRVQAVKEARIKKIPGYAYSPMALWSAHLGTPQPRKKIKSKKKKR
jgi:hypothetical protein